jgi:hypothetical protein
VEAVEGVRATATAAAVTTTAAAVTAAVGVKSAVNEAVLRAEELKAAELMPSKLETLVRTALAMETISKVKEPPSLCSVRH